MCLPNDRRFYHFHDDKEALTRNLTYQYMFSKFLLMLIICFAVVLRLRFKQCIFRTNLSSPSILHHLSSSKCIPSIGSAPLQSQSFRNVHPNVLDYMHSRQRWSTAEAVQRCPVLAPSLRSSLLPSSHSRVFY